MLEGLYIQCYKRIVSTEYHISSAVDVLKVSIIWGEDLQILSMRRKLFEGLGCATPENVEPVTLVIVIRLIISMVTIVCSS